MKYRKFLLVILVLIAVLSTILVFSDPYSDENAATTFLPLPENNEIEKIVDQAIRKTRSIRTFLQDTTTMFEYTGSSDGVSEHKSTFVEMSAKADNRNRLLWASIHSTFREDGNPVYIETEMYSTGDTLYVNMETRDESLGWVKTAQVAASWDKLVSYDNMISVLEKEMIRGSRTAIYDGSECIVLEIPVKDTDTITSILRDSYGLENRFRNYWELIRAFSGNFMVEIWINTDSMFIVKSVVDMRVEVTSEEVPQIEADSAVYSLSITTENHLIDEDLTIVLPEELKDAAIIYTINQ